MTLDIVALAVNAVISILIPVVILILMLVKNSKERVSLLLLFLAGVITYMAMEWGIKEHGLAWLFNHTDFAEFMNAHYIPYLLVVAAAGAVLACIPIIMIAALLMKKKLSFVMTVVLGLGYTMAESVMLVGYRSINTIVELVKGTDMELSSATAELFLSGYERILMSVIQIAVFVVLVYFIERNMTLQGSLIAVFSQTMAAFLPGFFIAFSLTDYYEVYDRSVALTLTYIVLTAAAICGGVVLYTLRYAFRDRSK